MFKHNVNSILYTCNITQVRNRTYSHMMQFGYLNISNDFLVTYVDVNDNYNLNSILVMHDLLTKKMLICFI